MENPRFKKVRLKIHGMHCASCEVLIERKLKKVAGIEKVQVSHGNGKADILCSCEINLRQLNNLVKEDGYRISSWDDRNDSIYPGVHRNTAKNYLQIGWIFLVIVSLYYILKQFNFLPDFTISQRMSYGLIFLIGLVAALSSCIAIVGGLLLALAGRYSEEHPNLSGIKKFKPHIYFNSGRIAGYTAFGAIVGALGSVMTLSPRTNGYLMIVVSLVMLTLGFQLLHLFPGLRRFTPKMPKFISHKIHDLSTKEGKRASFTLGALTFFLPCGFTQALQLYVLASGDWKIGALTMLTFSLGTLPALLSISAISSFAKGAFQQHFLRFAGVLIVLLSLFNINNGLTLAGYSFDPASAFSTKSDGTPRWDLSPVKIEDGRQVIKMTVNGYSYEPNRFIVVKDIPVEWQIDGANAAGCGKVIVIPSLGMSKYLSPQGITTVTFTPEKTGDIPFNCSMGMMTRGSGFTVIPNKTGIVGAKTELRADPQISVCDPAIASCPEVQKLAIEVSLERGVVPRSLIAKKNVPIELTIDDKDPLGGCMSVWVIPEYNVTIPMNGTVTKNVFTPTESGTIDITCSMGSKLAEINVLD